MHQIFMNFTSGTKLRNQITKKFSLPIKGQASISRTLAKYQIKMQQYFYVPKSRN